MPLRTLLALLWLHGRILRQNKSGCLVLLMLLLAGLLVGRQSSHVVEDTCYILYWSEDAWVHSLREAVPTGGPLHIEVAPVSRFTNEHGLIVYPVGAHSIQLRPSENYGEPWRVWYWYSGDNPEVLHPAIEWFWQVTREHHERAFPEVRVSSLQPVNPLTQSTKLVVQNLFRGQSAKLAILLGALFYCVAYLPAMFVAEQRHGHMVDVLATKPGGLQGWARVCCVFYGLLAFAICGPLVASFGWHGNVHIWVCTVSMSIAYLGIAFAVGCRCGSVASTSTTLMIYAAVSAMFVIASQLHASFGLRWISMEGSWMQVAHADGTAWFGPIGSILVWTLVWSVVGKLSLRRLA